MRVNNNGEVFVFPSMYDERPKSSQDLSNEYIDIYEEVPPYSVDVTTGEFLNKTSLPVKKKVGRKNIQETIQSFADDVDIYKILERVAISGDSSFLTRKVGTFGDFVNLPDNINDLNDYVKKAFESNKNVSRDILDAAINSSLSSAEIQAVISKHVEQAIIASQKQIKKTEVND